MTDRFTLIMESVPGLVRSLGDRARDAQSAAKDGRDLLSYVEGLNGSASRAVGPVNDALRQIGRAQTGFYNLQSQLAQRAELIAQAEGDTALTKAIQAALKPPPAHHWYDVVVDPFVDAWNAAEHFVTHDPLEALHTGLDIVGFVPVVGDVANAANALIYLGQGDVKDAALSGVALIPVAGGVAIAARMAAKGEKAVQVLSAAQRDERIIQALGKIPGLQVGTWENLSQAERLQTLRSAAEELGKIDGRPPPAITSKTAGAGVYGSYNASTHTITFGSHSLNNDPVHEVVNTLVHEDRHAYQHYAIQHPEVHPDPQQVADWKHNFEPGNYVTPQQSATRYRRQPVERDAWDQGDRIAGRMYGSQP